MNDDDANESPFWVDYDFTFRVSKHIYAKNADDARDRVADSMWYDHPFTALCTSGTWTFVDTGELKDPVFVDAVPDEQKVYVDDTEDEME